jgi:hypothetical protein
MQSTEYGKEFLSYSVTGMKTLHILIITLSGITAIGIVTFVLIDIQSKSNENDMYVFGGDYGIVNNITTIYNKSFFVSQSYPQDYVNNAIQFHGVTFSIPNYTGFTNPGGLIGNPIKFTDNTNETLITGYGGHPPNTITVLTKHVNPQAGVTRHSNGSVNFLVNIPDNQTVVKTKQIQMHYYDNSNIIPKVSLYDYFYKGIDSDGIVTINNQTFYQTTLDYNIYNLLKDAPIQFHNVTFSFPEGTLFTPGGAFVNLDVRFQDGYEEIYGGTTKTPDGSGTMLSGISIPTSSGPHLATNSTTVLGNHTNPQAGITIYNDKLKLLVSKQLIENSRSSDPFGIIALVIYHPPDACLGPCPPNTFYLKTNSESPTYLLGYNICDGSSCTMKNDLSVLLPIRDILRPDFKMIPLSKDLQWKYGDTVQIRLYVSQVNDSKTASMIDLGSSTIVP